MKYHFGGIDIKMQSSMVLIYGKENGEEINQSDTHP